MAITITGALAPLALASGAVWVDGDMKSEIYEWSMENFCKGSPETVKILYGNGLLSEGRECVFHGKYFSVVRNTYIKFHSDSVYRPLYFDGHILEIMPDSDLLIARKLESLEGHAITVYNNAAAAIRPSTKRTILGEATHYTIDPAKGKRLMPRPDMPQYHRGFYELTASQDSRFLFGYVDRNLMIKVDLRDFSIKVIGIQTSQMYWDRGYEQVAASKDGRYVHFTRGGAIVDTQNCGDAWFEGYTTGRTNVTSQCARVNILPKIDSLVNDIRYMYKAEFTDNDNALELYSWRYSAPYLQKVRLYRPGYTPPTLDYLALGDSISSGEGDTHKNPATNKKYYRAQTDVEENRSKLQPREKCHQSTRSYPYLLALWMNLSSQGPRGQWDSVACSGAATWDISPLTASYMGQAMDDKHTPRLQGYTNVADLQARSLNEMIPGRVQQVEFVRKYKPKVITLTAGANNIDFSGKLRSCLQWPTTCDWAGSRKPELGRQIADQYGGLLKLYKDLYDNSGNMAKVYVLGYPRLINDSPDASCGQNVGHMDAAERKMMVEATNYLNLVIQRAANAAGAYYVDISDSLNTARLCDSTKIPYVTGIAFAGSSEQQESYHPNNLGHLAILDTINKRLGGKSMLSFPVCSGAGAVNCPQTGADAAAPPIPPEFGTTEINSRSAPMTVGQAVRGSLVTTTVPRYSTAPGGQLQVALRSDPIDLGVVQADQTGAIDTQIRIPDGTPPGYHTLILTGRTFSGEPVEYTQTILVTGSDPADLDANGVSDKSQKCGAFMPTSGKDVDLDGVDDACDPEITEPIWYMARNGLAPLGEDPAKIYLFRNSRAYDYTRVYGDWVDKSKDTSNLYARVAVSLTDNTKGAYNKIVYTRSGQQSIPIVLARDVDNQCMALKPDILTRTWEWSSPYYKPRGFTKLAALPAGVECE